MKYLLAILILMIPFIGEAGTCVKKCGGGGVSDIVDDTTPQLGGDLDVNGNLIISNTDIILELDADDDGTESLFIREGGGDNIFELTEGAVLKVHGSPFDGSNYTELLFSGISTAATITVPNLTINLGNMTDSFISDNITVDIGDTGVVTTGAASGNCAQFNAVTGNLEEASGSCAASAGDVGSVGDVDGGEGCTSGACFDGTSATQTTFEFENNAVIDLDEDNDNTDASTCFRVKSGADVEVFTVCEDGNVTATGQITSGADATPSLDFDDSDDTGAIDASIAANCPTTGDCDLTLQGSVADILVTFARFDSDNTDAGGSPELELGLGHSGPILIGAAGNTTTITIEADSGINIGAAGVQVLDDGDGAIKLLGLGNGNDEDLTINFDDTANTIALSSSTGVTTVDYGSIGVVTTGSIKGAIPIATSTGGALAINTVTIATAASDYDLPDSCDTATGNWVMLYVRDVSETASLTVTDTLDTIVYKGLSLGANDELDSPGAAQDSVSVVCLEADKWYVTSNSGDWTDGGPAD